MSLTKEQKESLQWAIQESEHALKRTKNAFQNNPTYQPYKRSVEKHKSNLKGLNELLGQGRSTGAAY